MNEVKEPAIIFTKRNMWIGLVSYIIVAMIIAWVFVR